MSEIKVGDELAFCCGYGNSYQIHPVEKITKTGRIKVGRWELDPNLRVRGRSGYGEPYEGEIPTPEIRDAIKRQNLLYRVRAMKPDKLTTSQLERIAAILAEESC